VLVGTMSVSLALTDHRHCVRTVVRYPEPPGQVRWFTGTFLCTSLLRKVVWWEVRWCVSMWV